MSDWMDSYGASPSSAPVNDTPVSAPAAPAAQPVSDSDWMNGYRPQANVDLSLKTGQNIPPDKAAQVLKLQDQTGLPTKIISDNLEDVQAKQAQQSLSPQFIQDHPKTSAIVGSDPHWASLLGPDIPGVGYIERQLGYLENSSFRSLLELERTYYGLKGAANLGGPDNMDRVNEIDRQLSTDFAPPAGASPVTKIFGKAAEVTPEFGAPLALGVLGGAPGAVAMAGAFGGMETANAYLDFKKMRDAEGNPIHDNLARGAALASGAITSALSFIPGLGAEAENIPAGLRMLQREGMSGILESPTLRSSVEGLLKDIGASSLKMGGFAGGSALGHVTAQTLAQLQNDGSLETMSPVSILHAIATPENMSKVAKMAAGGAIVGGVLKGGEELTNDMVRGGMGAWNIYTDYSKATEALNTQTGWTNVGNAMKNMKSFDMAPEQVGKVMERLAGDGNVYIPLDKWQEWADTQKVDPRAAWGQAMGDTQAYDEALKTGGDLQMSSKRYASQIAPSDHNDFFSKVLRNSPEAMNAEEAEGFIGKQSPEQQAARDAAFKIKEAIAPTPETTAAATGATETGMSVPEPLPAQESEPITPAPVSPEETQAEQHIQAAKQDLGHKPLDLEGMGMSEKQMAAIQEAESRAHLAARDEMVRSITDKAARQKSRAWLSERSEVEDQVEQDSLTHPEFVAQEVLSQPIQTKARAQELQREAVTKYEADKQRWDAWQDILKPRVKPPSGMAEEYASLPLRYKDSEGRGYDELMQEAQEKGLAGPNDDFWKTVRELKRPTKPMSAQDYVPDVLRELEPLKLSRSIVKSEFPDADMDSLKGMLSDTVGVHPDEAAAVLGFDSGDELLYKLKGLPKRADWVQQETDRRMVENHPEITSDTNLPEAAIKAVNNEERGRLLRKQLEHFYSDEFAAAKGLTARIAGRIPNTKELKADVARDIGTKNYRQLAPNQYLQAMRYAQADAEKSLKAGELQRLVDAKKAELRSLEMYRAAQKAIQTVNKRVDRVKSYNRKPIQAMLGKAGGTYQDDVNKLISSPAFQNYKQMKFSDLMDYIDQIDQRVHEAREQGKLYAQEAFKTVDDARTAILYQIDKEFPDVREQVSQFPKPKNPLEINFVPKLVAYQLNIENVANEIDNYKPNGLIKKLITDPINGESAAKQAELVDRHINSLPDHNYNKMLEAIEGTKMWYAKSYYIPEMNMSLIRPQMIRIARLRQNDYTWKAFLDGYGLTDAQGMAVISQLTDPELDLVDGMSKNFEALRGEAFALRKAQTGIEPETVKPSPYEITRKDGSVRKMEGGYSPLTFDEDLSLGSKEEDLFDKNWFTSRPSDSNLRNRTNPGGRAPSLDLNSEMKVLGKMIKWVSYSQSLANAQKILGDKAIAAHIVAAVGKQKYDLFKPWLRDVSGNNPLAVSPMDHTYSVGKNAVMIATLGWKTTSELKHLNNFGMVVNELGIEYAMKGLKVFYKDPRAISDMWENIQNKSPYMRQMAAHIDRDISDASNRLNIGGEKSIFGNTILGRLSSVKSAYMQDLTRAFFYLYGVSYTSIAAPSWYGAYLKALDGEVGGLAKMDEKAAIAYADRVVRTKVVSGNTADLAAVMRDKGIMKNFVWYFRPSSLRFNDMYENWSKFKKSGKMPDDVAKFVGNEFIGRFIPALISGLIGSQIPKGAHGVEKLAKWGVSQIASGYAELTPWTRFIPSALESRGHEWKGDPMSELMSTFTNSAFDIAHHIGGHREWKTREIKDIAMSAGYFSGLPSSQMIDSWAVAHDWLTTHHYHPDNTASGIWHVATGKEPRK